MQIQNPFFNIIKLIFNINQLNVLLQFQKKTKK